MAKISREETRHDLQEDVVAERGKQLLNYIQKHQNTLLVAVVAVAAVWLIATFVRNARASAIEQANLNLFQARNDFARALMTADKEQKSQYFEAARKKIEPLVSKYAGQPLGQRALFQLGVVKFRQLDFAGARQDFEKYRDAAPDAVGQARGMVAVGACLENEAFVSGDASLLDKALAAYAGAASKAGDSYVKYQALLYQARVLARQPDKRAEAVSLLERIIKERPAESIKPPARVSTAAGDETIEDAIKQLEGRSLAEEAQEQIDRLKAVL